MQTISDNTLQFEKSITLLAYFTCTHFDSFHWKHRVKMSTEITKMTTGSVTSNANAANSDKHLGLADESAENSISIFSSDYKK